MLRITYSKEKDDFAIKQIIEAVFRLENLKPSSYNMSSKDGEQLLWHINYMLSNAFEAGREFQKRYNEKEIE